MMHAPLKQYSHEPAPGGWDVVTSEGIYSSGPFLSEHLAAAEAVRLNRAVLRNEGKHTHDYPACAVFRCGKCTCDACNEQPNHPSSPAGGHTS
jgi:hypothetical protein